MKTLNKLKTDPRVTDAFSEGGSQGDGYWIFLKAGFICPDTDCHAVHEWTIRDLLRSFRTVKPCFCKDCQPTTPTTTSHKS